MHSIIINYGFANFICQKWALVCGIMTEQQTSLKTLYFNYCCSLKVIVASQRRDTHTRECIGLYRQVTQV